MGRTGVKVTKYDKKFGDFEFSNGMKMRYQNKDDGNRKEAYLSVYDYDNGNAEKAFTMETIETELGNDEKHDFDSVGYLENNYKYSEDNKETYWEKYSSQQSSTLSSETVIKDYDKQIGNTKISNPKQNEFLVLTETSEESHTRTDS